MREFYRCQLLFLRTSAQNVHVRIGGMVGKTLVGDMSSTARDVCVFVRECVCERERECVCVSVTYDDDSLLTVDTTC